MSPLLPPPDLASRRLKTIILARGTVIHRFYTAAHNPVFFDRGLDGRFNAPDGSYGVLYAAEEVDGAFAESFLRVPGRTLLPPDLIARKAYVRLRIVRDLTLVLFQGKGLAPLGATSQVPHGGLPYDGPHAWSAALRSHPQHIDGIAYSARHDDSAICYALFDHPPACVEEVSRERDLDQDWFWTLAESYGVGLAP